MGQKEQLGHIKFLKQLFSGGNKYKEANFAQETMMDRRKIHNML